MSVPNEKTPARRALLAETTGALGDFLLMLLFFLVLTPTALLLRLGGYDPLWRRRGGRTSFWRRPGGAPCTPASLRRQD